MSNLNIKRFLHVIYFFEDAKTKSFRVSLLGVKIIITAAIILAIWTGSSIYMIAQLTGKQLELRQKLAESKDQLFEYQVAYDNVFERAYKQTPQKPVDEPAPQKSTVKSELLTEKPISHEEPKLAAKTAPTTDTSLNTKNLNREITQTATSLKTDEKIDQGTVDIDIDNLQFTKRASALDFKFRIRNNSPDKASGYIWASATIKIPETQEIIQISVPEGIIQAENNQNLIRSRATRFGIMRHKTRSFLFPLPQGIKSAEFQSLSIKILDASGDIQTHRINVPFDYGLIQSAPQPSLPAQQGNATPTRLSNVSDTEIGEDEEAENAEDDYQEQPNPPTKAAAAPIAP